MEKSLRNNDYALAALFFSLLSLIGSCLSILNAIPLMITYQLLQVAKGHGLKQNVFHIIDSLYQFAILLTFCITVLYLSIQL